jgi:hypothetical protein
VQRAAEGQGLGVIEQSRVAGGRACHRAGQRAKALTSVSGMQEPASSLVFSPRRTDELMSPEQNDP